MIKIGTLIFFSNLKYFTTSNPVQSSNPISIIYKFGVNILEFLKSKILLKTSVLYHDFLIFFARFEEKTLSS